MPLLPFQMPPPVAALLLLIVLLRIVRLACELLMPPPLTLAMLLEKLELTTVPVVPL